MLSVPVRAAGARDATNVVQCYVAEVLDAGRPAPRRLAGWGKVTVPAGDERTVVLELDGRAVERWDEVTGTWQVRPGRYVVDIAASAAVCGRRRSAGEGSCRIVCVAPGPTAASLSCCGGGHKCRSAPPVLLHTRFTRSMDDFFYLGETRWDRQHVAKRQRRNLHHP